MKSMLLLLLATVTFLAACGGSGTGGAPAALPGQDAADANATLAAVNLAYQATAAVQARQTADAAQATAAHEDMLRATAGAATVAAATATTSAQTTADALVVQQTVAAMQLAADMATSSAMATSAWATPTAAAQQTAAAQEAANIAMLQRDAEIRLAQEQRREETWLHFQPILYGLLALVLAAVALAGLGFVGFIIWRAVHLQRHPVVRMDGAVYAQQSGGLLAPPRLMVVSAPARPVSLPAPTRAALGPGVVAADSGPVALPRLVKMHVLVVGPTDAGKSNAMRALLAQRPNVTVIDPHTTGNDWNGAQVVGGGRDFEAIAAFVEWMRGELSDRYRERNGGKKLFEPRTVAIDEMPAIVAAVGREIEDVWRAWLREGRKVGLFLVLASQSSRVRTLGIQGEGDVLDNFGAVLVLGDMARQQYGGVVAGMEHPAVLRTQGGARPVVIPHMPEGDQASAAVEPMTTIPAGDLDGNGQEDVILVGAPTAVWRARPSIDLNNIDWRAEQEIIDSYRRWLTIAGVQRELFPSYADSGGRAFGVIREVLIRHGYLEMADGRAVPTLLASGL